MIQIEPDPKRKRTLKKLLFAVLLVLTFITFSFPNPAFAAGDAASGANVFKANCNACHLGGKNVVNTRKTLNKSDLEKYGMYSADAIITQVTNGKGAMPRFGGRLTPKQIEDVAAYVLAQADKGW